MQDNATQSMNLTYFICIAQENGHNFSNDFTITLNLTLQNHYPLSKYIPCQQVKQSNKTKNC